MVQSHSTIMPFIIQSDLTMSLKSPGPGDPIHDATQHPVRISCSSSTNLWNDCLWPSILAGAIPFMASGQASRLSAQLRKDWRRRYRHLPLSNCHSINPPSSSPLFTSLIFSSTATLPTFSNLLTPQIHCPRPPNPKVHTMGSTRLSCSLGV
jgi:hypothetical protein